MSSTNLSLKQQQEILQNTLKYFKILTPKEMIREIEKKETKKQEKVETPPNELENQNEDPMVDSLNILN